MLQYSIGFLHRSLMQFDRAFLIPSLFLPGWIQPFRHVVRGERAVSTYKEKKKCSSDSFLGGPAPSW
jgi:hypothetical protein